MKGGIDPMAIAVIIKLYALWFLKGGFLYTSHSTKVKEFELKNCKK